MKLFYSVLIVFFLSSLAFAQQGTKIVIGPYSGMPIQTVCAVGGCTYTTMAQACVQTGEVNIFTPLSAVQSNISTASGATCSAPVNIHPGGSLGNTTTFRVGAPSFNIATTGTGSIIFNALATYTWATLGGTGSVTFNSQPVLGDYNIFTGGGVVSGLQTANADIFGGNIQRAADSLVAGGTLQMGVSTYTLSAPITLHESGINVVGLSETETIIDAQSISGYAFNYLLPNGTAGVQAPSFKNFTILCGATSSGIQLNSPTGGFTNDSSTQLFMMRPVIDHVFINNNGVAGNGTGISCSKCFDGQFTYNYIQNFQNGLILHGSDINDVHDNRIVGCGSASGGSAISLNPIATVGYYGTMGSQNEIHHNDLLSPVAGADSFIFSRDRQTRIYDNYLEQNPARNHFTAAIWLAGGVSAIVRDNRIEVDTASTSYWLRVDSNYQTIDASNNTNQGGPPPGVNFVIPFLYAFNNTYRNILTHNANFSDIGFPVNSYISAARPTGKVVYEWDAGRPDLALGTFYGPSVTVSNNDLIIPPIAGEGSDILIQSNGNIDPGAVGVLTVGIIAKAAVSGQVLNYVLSDNSFTPVASGTVTLTTLYATYALGTSNTYSTALWIQLYNSDMTSNSNVSLKSLYATY